MDFKNKVVVITGASSGIGEAAAEQFAKRGANLVLVARRKEKLEQVAQKLSKYSIKTLVQVCDVSDKQQVKEMSEKVIETFSRIDILVNNAGFVIYGKVEELSIEDIESESMGFVMKLDPATKHFICKRCGLYATREQVSDIRYKLSRKESTKSDKQYDYLDWWQKSKKDKDES